ncbi:hypothetical protein Fmac_029036 [Flemingia macrophylla]|uniref:RNase H type-1 domain-containing protein n=1 Tax=Flemingia macrophylla TaxID=520843 RepID=A0ABD1L967_9FABA
MPPSQGFIKVNIDGGGNGYSGPVGSGVICWGPKGNIFGASLAIWDSLMP